MEQWLQKVNLEQLILEYCFFWSLLVFKDIKFLKRTILFGKLPFLSSYNTFHKLQNLYAFFDLVFVQLLVIERTRNKFVGIEVVAECYLIN